MTTVIAVASAVAQVVATEIVVDMIINAAADMIADNVANTVVDTAVQATAPVVDVLDTSSVSGDDSLLMFNNSQLDDSGVEVQKSEEEY